MRARGLVSAVVASACCAGPLAPTALAQGSGADPGLPANDLNDLIALTGVPTPEQAPLQDNPEPPLEPAPRATCGPGSRPLEGVQGRVPASAINSPEARRGWTCNLEVIGHHRTTGGFRTWRYVDRQGHECAFHDTSLESPANVVRMALGPSAGVAVLDMSDPARPVQTATLTSLPMLSPHESLNLNARRGLLAANMGNGTTLPGLMSVYDVSRDCRHPVELATIRAARFGHESGFAPDGDTYWIAGGEGIAAIDVSDPRNPRNLWEGNVFAHGLNVAADGNRLYDADPITGNLVILDVSEVQARRPSPQVREVSRLIWDTVTVPQNTAPVTIGGRRYLLEFDEFAFRFTALPPPHTVGAARMIDISDEAHPRVVSNLRLEVNQPAQHAAAANDPSPLPMNQFTYSAHYCAVPREVDPQIAACSFINSGLRIFDIRDPRNPREVAYFVAPPPRDGNFAMSQPAFVPERREVWYTDGTSGFWSLRVDPAAWPADPPPPFGCASPSGRLRGRTLGPARLGLTRARAARGAGYHRRRGRRLDFYCLSGGAIRVGYLSPRGRAVALITRNPYYSLGPAQPGGRLTARVARRLRLSRVVRRPGGTWYVARGRRANGLLRVGRGRRIRDVGVAERRLTLTTAATRRFLTALR